MIGTRRRAAGLLSWRVSQAWFLALFVASITAACSSAEPLPGAPEAVRSTLEPFIAEGFRCVGPSQDVSAFDQWNCRLSDHSVNFQVVLDGSNAGVKQIVGVVDQAAIAAPSEDTFTAFVSRLVKASPAAESSTDIDAWVADHLTGGGQEHLGPAFVTQDPFGAVTHFSLFFGDIQ